MWNRKGKCLPDSTRLRLTCYLGIQIKRYLSYHRNTVLVESGRRKFYTSIPCCSCNFWRKIMMLIFHLYTCCADTASGSDSSTVRQLRQNYKQIQGCLEETETCHSGEPSLSFISMLIIQSAHCFTQLITKNLHYVICLDNDKLP